MTSTSQAQAQVAQTQAQVAQTQAQVAQTQAQVAKIHQASSLIVVNHRFEFLMLKRSPHTKFMPNFWVFPGGKLETQDAQTWDLLSPEQKAAFELGQSHWVNLMAGIRETFEEAGLLGDLLEKAKLHQVDLLLEDVLKNSQFSDHWLTPESYPIRFDTLFFMYYINQDHVDQNHPIQIDQQEIVDGRWWKASEMLNAYARQEIEMGAPTIRLLVDLASFEQGVDTQQFSIEQVMQMRRDRTLQRNAVICPKVVKDQEGTVLLFNEDQFFNEPLLRSIDLIGQGDEVRKDRLVLRGKCLVPEITKMMGETY